MKPNTLLNLAVFLLASLAVSNAAEAPKTAARPNIVFFFADDWGRDASCYATPPRLRSAMLSRRRTSIASCEGVRFTHAFYDSPQCTPSRAAIVSGCYFWRCGSDAFLAGGDWRGRQNPFKELPRFPHLLADSGYATAKAFKTLSFIPTLKSASVEGIKTYLRTGYIHAGKTPADQERRRRDSSADRDSIRRVLSDCPKGTPFSLCSDRSIRIAHSAGFGAGAVEYQP